MRPSVRKLVAAVSAGGLDSNAIVHLNYGEDQTVTVDFNLVLTRGCSLKRKASGEESAFSQSQLYQLINLPPKVSLS